MERRMRVLPTEEYINKARSLYLFGPDNVDYVDGLMFTISNGKLDPICKTFKINNEENNDFSVTDVHEFESLHNNSTELETESLYTIHSSSIKDDEKIVVLNTTVKENDITSILSQELPIEHDNCTIIIVFGNSRCTPFTRIYNGVHKFEDIDIINIENDTCSINSMNVSMEITQIKTATFTADIAPLEQLALHLQEKEKEKK